MRKIILKDYYFLYLFLCLNFDIPDNDNLRTKGAKFIYFQNEELIKLSAFHLQNFRLKMKKKSEKNKNLIHHWGTLN